MADHKDNLVQIGALAKRLGITTRTIRYYEEIGLMGPSIRQVGGTRLYCGEDIRRLKFILKLKDLGINLKEMQELAENFETSNQDFERITPHLLEILARQIDKIDQKISNLSSLRQDIVDYRGRIFTILQEKMPASE